MRSGRWGRYVLAAAAGWTVSRALTVVTFLVSHTTLRYERMTIITPEVGEVFCSAAKRGGNVFVVVVVLVLSLIHI